MSKPDNHNPGRDALWAMLGFLFIMFILWRANR